MLVIRIVGAGKQQHDGECHRRFGDHRHGGAAAGAAGAGEDDAGAAFGAQLLLVSTASSSARSSLCSPHRCVLVVSSTSTATELFKSAFATIFAAISSQTTVEP